MISNHKKTLNDNKDVFLDRLVRANPIAFEEAMKMFSDEVKEFFLRVLRGMGGLITVILKKS